MTGRHRLDQELDPRLHFLALTIACLVTSSVSAADDPFVGKWKVNSSKSKLNDEMQVEVAGANRYALTFAPGFVDTVVAGGSDQPALSETTLSVTVKGPNSWVVVRKRKGRTLLTGYWTLSEDGKTLNDATGIWARRFEIVVLALCVRADGGDFRLSGHVGQPKPKR